MMRCAGLVFFLCAVGFELSADWLQVDLPQRYLGGEIYLAFDLPYRMDAARIVFADGDLAPLQTGQGLAAGVRWQEGSVQVLNPTLSRSMPETYVNAGIYPLAAARVVIKVDYALKRVQHWIYPAGYLFGGTAVIGSGSYLLRGTAQVPAVSAILLDEALLEAGVAETLRVEATLEAALAGFAESDGCAWVWPQLQQAPDLAQGRGDSVWRHVQQSSLVPEQSVAPAAPAEEFGPTAIAGHCDGKGYLVVDVPTGFGDRLRLECLRLTEETQAVEVLSAWESGDGEAGEDALAGIRWLVTTREERTQVALELSAEFLAAWAGAAAALRVWLGEDAFVHSCSAGVGAGLSWLPLVLGGPIPEVAAFGDGRSWLQLVVEPAAGSAGYSVMTNFPDLAYSVESDAPWLQVIRLPGQGSGDLVFRWDANPRLFARRASLRISGLVPINYIDFQQEGVFGAPPQLELVFPDALHGTEPLSGEDYLGHFSYASFPWLDTAELGWLWALPGTGWFFSAYFEDYLFTETALFPYLYVFGNANEPPGWKLYRYFPGEGGRLWDFERGSWSQVWIP